MNLSVHVFFLISFMEISGEISNNLRMREQSVGGLASFPSKEACEGG